MRDVPDLEEHHGTAREAYRLAEEINAEHRRAKAAFGKSLQHVKRAGKLLLEAKERTPHGQWGPWLEENFEFTARTAQLWMQIYSHWPEIEAKTKSGSDLNMTLTGALEAIRPPQQTAITREESVVVPLQFPSVELREEPTEEEDREPGVEAVEEPTEAREQLKVEKGETYDYGEALRAKAEEDPDRIVEIVRFAVAEYKVRRQENTLRVTRERLLKAGWEKCSCCDGYGITNSS